MVASRLVAIATPAPGPSDSHMKVLYSWQSDTPVNVGRAGIGGALAAAIAGLDLEAAKRPTESTLRRHHQGLRELPWCESQPSQAASCQSQRCGDGDITRAPPVSETRQFENPWGLISGYEPRGREFESLQAHQLPEPKKFSASLRCLPKSTSRSFRVALSPPFPESAAKVQGCIVFGARIYIGLRRVCGRPKDFQMLKARRIVAAEEKQRSAVTRYVPYWARAL
jgi:hypothetical protein